MRRHEFLRRLHQRLQPRTYFEIGVRTGRSLTLSRVPSVGVDPFFEVKAELHCDLHLVRTTSDEFFARPEPFAHFGQPVVDLAFIDGMHLAEFALRDFMNTERSLPSGQRHRHRRRPASLGGRRRSWTHRALPPTAVRGPATSTR